MAQDATIIAFPNQPKFGLVGSADPVEIEPLELEELGEAVSFAPAGAIVEGMLDKLDRLRRLVSEGRIQGLIFVGQDPVTGYFLTETCLDPAMNRSELFGYMGVLETLKMEIGETAAVAPVIDLSGTIIDPMRKKNDHLHHFPRLHDLRRTDIARSGGGGSLRPRTVRQAVRGL